MTEEQIEKLAEELSDEDLNALAGGKELSPEQKEKLQRVLKWTSVALGTAAGTGAIIAALIGWQKGKGPFKGLYKNSNTPPQNNSDLLFDDDAVPMTPDAAVL